MQGLTCASRNYDVSPAAGIVAGGMEKAKSLTTAAHTTQPGPDWGKRQREPFEIQGRKKRLDKNIQKREHRRKGELKSLPSARFVYSIPKISNLSSALMVTSIGSFSGSWFSRFVLPSPVPLLNPPRVVRT